jgi:hypothetical protein
MRSKKGKLIFNCWCSVRTFGLPTFVHSLRNIAGRPLTYLKLQSMLQQVAYQSVATLHTDIRNSSTAL